MDLNLCQGQCLLFTLVCGRSLVSAILWGSCPYLSRSFCLLWLGSAGGEVLQEKTATPISPSRCVISLGNLHSFSCSVLLCPCRVHQLAGETSIQLPSLEQRCTYLVAELIVLGHFTPTTRSTATALKYLIQKQTPGWTPLQLQCSQKAGGAIQHVSVGLLREEDSGRKFLPASRGVSGLLGGDVG